MHVRGLLTLLFVLSFTAVITGKFCSLGLHSETTTMTNAIRNHIGFEIGFLDMFLISLCFLVFFVQKERNKVNEVYRRRLVFLTNNSMHQGNVVENLIPLIEGYRNRNTGLEVNLINVNRNTNVLLAWIQDTKVYPQSEAAVMEKLVLTNIKAEVAILKENIRRELHSLHQEIGRIREFVHEVSSHGY